MPRPTKCRKVDFLPESTYFIPLGKRKCEVDETTLKVEELEAMRLKDIEELNQEECAERMQVSRQTFQNIIDKARKKVAQALTQGKAIQISGGNYTSGLCKFICLKCDSVYKSSHQGRNCPTCGSEEVICEKKKRTCHRWKD